jgi:hypothetical protein
VSERRGAAIAVAFFTLYTVALTWPGALPFNRIRPFVLGVPFSLAWVTLWVILGGLTIWALDRAIRHDADES